MLETIPTLTDDYKMDKRITDAGYGMKQTISHGQPSKCYPRRTVAKMPLAVLCPRILKALGKSLWNCWQSLYMIVMFNAGYRKIFFPSKGYMLVASPLVQERILSRF